VDSAPEEFTLMWKISLQVFLAQGRKYSKINSINEDKKNDFFRVFTLEKRMYNGALLFFSP
jgi:hypothetical protein